MPECLPDVSRPSRSHPWCPVWRGGKGVFHSRRSLPLSAQCDRVASALVGPYSPERHPETTGPAEKTAEKPNLIYRPFSLMLYVVWEMSFMSEQHYTKRAARTNKILRRFPISIQGIFMEFYIRTGKQRFRQVTQHLELESITYSVSVCCKSLAAVSFLCGKYGLCQCNTQSSPPEWASRLQVYVWELRFWTNAWNVNVSHTFKTRQSVF